MDLGVATDSVSANMTSTPTQDSAFLRLPLEIRHEIYSYLIYLQNTKTLSLDETRDPASGLGPVTRLLGISQGRDRARLTIEPYYIHARKAQISFEELDLQFKWARECHRAALEGDTEAYNDALAELTKYDMKAPHQLKFWKVCIPVGNLFSIVMYFVDVDFRARAVCIRRPSGNGSSSDRVSHYWSAKKEAFINAMRFFTEQDGFDGITIAGMSLFMEKVDLSQIYASPP
ncbi:hypothetical protein KCU93_g9316, partial [Aureobasidium melanogenum]